MASLWKTQIFKFLLIQLLALQKSKIHFKSIRTQETYSKELGLETYKEVFDKEMIDLKMLLELNEGEFMEMVRDIGMIPWGHRHTLRKAVENINKNNKIVIDDNSNDKNHSMLEEPQSKSSHEELLMEEDSIGDEELVLEEYSVDENIEENSLFDVGAKKFNLNCSLCEKTTQHRCTICGHMVCNLFCSQQDPDSSDEMQRRHLPGDPRCSIQL